MKKTDFAVIEVGMGGKFDATNIIKPEVAVLTNVGLDHTEILGNTVEEIAHDKAGIIKAGVRVVTGVIQNSVIQIVESTCRNKGSGINLLGRDFRYELKRMTDSGSYFDYWGIERYENLFIPLLGQYQIENAALAINAVQQSGEFREKEIRLGLENAFIPGRLEIVAKSPLIVLDGAHNPDKMNALVSAVKYIWPERKIVAVLAIKEDKKAKEMIEAILSISSELVLTSFESLLDQGNVISINPHELKNVIKKLKYRGSVNIEQDSVKALDLAKKKAGKEDIILVTGSLYLIGAIKKYFNEI